VTTFEDGVLARSRLLTQGGDVETILSRAETMLAQSWLLRDEGAWDYTVLAGDGGTKGTVEREQLDATPTLEQLNERMHRRWVELTARTASRGDGLVEIDDPGCDVVDARGQLITGDNHCMQDCCARHDQCYFDRTCTSASWAFGDGDTVLERVLCQACNVEVVTCLGLCASREDFEASQRSSGANPCPENQHRCWDIDCNDQFYCRTDCYREPSPCEESAAADADEHWCADDCRDLSGRKGFALPDDVACADDRVTTNCDCDIAEGAALDGFHGRCKDSSCSPGRRGFCAASDDVQCGETGSVPGSPCCGGANQPCCAQPDDADIAGDGNCDHDRLRCWESDGESMCLPCGANDQIPCRVVDDQRFNRGGCDSGFIHNERCYPHCRVGDLCCTGWAEEACEGQAICSHHRDRAPDGTPGPWATRNEGHCIECGGANQRCCVGAYCEGSACELSCDAGLECAVGDLAEARGWCEDPDPPPSGTSGGGLVIESVSPYDGCNQVNFRIRNRGSVASGPFTVTFGNAAAVGSLQGTSLAAGGDYEDSIATPFGSPSVCDCIRAACAGPVNCEAATRCPMRLAVVDQHGELADDWSLASHSLCNGTPCGFAP
jgi:hypothetical protein